MVAREELGGPKWPLSPHTASEPTKNSRKFQNQILSQIVNISTPTFWLRSTPCTHLHILYVPFTSIIVGRGVGGAALILHLDISTKVTQRRVGLNQKFRIHFSIQILFFHEDPENLYIFGSSS